MLVLALALRALLLGPSESGDGVRSEGSGKKEGNISCKIMYLLSWTTSAVVRLRLSKHRKKEIKLLTSQEQLYTYKHKIEAFSWNHCCSR